MIAVSDWFKTWIEKQTLNLLRKFSYDDIHESERVEGFGSVSRASDAIVSGGCCLSLINADKHWNKFLTDKTNLRRTAKLQLGIAGEVTTIARAGIARAAITASGLVALKEGSVIEAAVDVPRGGEWADILTGWGDDPEFDRTLVSLPIRDKMAGLLEKVLGSSASPLDYYSSSYNPADLAWSILTVYGGLDSTADASNADIDYSIWAAYKADCTSEGLSLKARFTGQTVGAALDLLKELTNSDIFVAGDGKIRFYLFVPEGPPGGEQEFDEDNTREISARLDSGDILNHLTVYYDYDIPANLAVNGDMEAVNSWADKGSPLINARSSEQVFEGSYARKISTDEIFQGAYQDIVTEVGKTYRLKAQVYVSQGDAVLGVGSVAEHFGFAGKGEAEDSFNADRIYLCHGSYATVPRDGTLQSIVVYIKGDGVSSNVKCALYHWTGSQYELVTNGVTEEKLIADDFDGWAEFTFSTPPSVVSSDYYYLAVWCETSGTKRYYNSAWSFWWKNSAYNGFPTPITSDGNAAQKISVYTKYVLGSDLIKSGIATEAAWTELSITFTAEATTTRVFFQAASIHNSIFYVDDLSVQEDYSPFWTGSYLKEDPASQQAPPNGFGLCPEVVSDTMIWHASLSSASVFADRKVGIHSEPLEVVNFKAFAEGLISEIGDYIKFTNAFLGYDDDYFRVFKKTSIELNTATVIIEAANFQDIVLNFTLDDAYLGLLDQDYNPLL